MRRSRLRLAGVAALGAVLVGGAYGFWTHQAERTGMAQADPVAQGDPARAVSAASSAAYPRPGPGLNLLAREASPYLQLPAPRPQPGVTSVHLDDVGVRYAKS